MGGRHPWRWVSLILGIISTAINARFTIPVHLGLVDPGTDFEGIVGVVWLASIFPAIIGLPYGLVAFWQAVKSKKGKAFSVVATILNLTPIVTGFVIR